jgi:chemotaxis signal transduction protein
MNAIIADTTDLSTSQIQLVDRFILTQVTGIENQFTLVFPATWVTEILRVDRDKILTLPFYNPLLMGIIDRDGEITPLISAARLLNLVPAYLSEKLIVVRLNKSHEMLGNMGLIVDRSIGTATRQELPPDLFSAHRAGDLVMMRSTLVPIDSWQPQYQLSD